jgi:hypothetical protein
MKGENTMYLYFWSDGTYSEEDLSNEKEFEFGIVDISTMRKGPIVAMTKNLTFEKKDSIEMTMEMTYDTPDIPFDPESAFVSTLKMNNESHAYNAYPLIRQMIACNEFVNGQSQFMDSRIFINKLKLKSPVGEYEITEENTDQDVADIFDKFGMRTNMSEIVKPGFCIMMNQRGYWRRVKLNSKDGYSDYLSRMRWTRALICFPDMETAYTCRYHTLRELEKIKELSVRVTYTPTPDKYDLGFLSDLNSPYTNEYVAYGIYDILRLCIFVPQIINIEQTLYNMDVAIEMNVVQEDQNIKLTITKKETKIGINTCIYNLLERIIGITMERRNIKEEWFYDNTREEEVERTYKKPNRFSKRRFGM